MTKPTTNNGVFIIEKGVCVGYIIDGKVTYIERVVQK